MNNGCPILCQKEFVLELLKDQPEIRTKYEQSVKGKKCSDCPFAPINMFYSIFSAFPWLHLLPSTFKTLPWSKLWIRNFLQNLKTTSCHLLKLWHKILVGLNFIKIIKLWLIQLQMWSGLSCTGQLWSYPKMDGQMRGWQRNCKLYKVKYLKGWFKY